MGWNMRGLFAILTSITFAAGCAAKNSCVPGQSAACTCASGDTGAQVCENGGTYGACDCGGHVSVGGNGSGGNGGDDMAGGGGSGGGGGGGVTPGQKRLFITSTAYAGTVAASVCENVAKSVNLTGTWKAWMSYASGVPTIDAIDDIGGTGPWVLLDGTVAFSNHAQLATAPSALIDVSETGQKLPGPLSVWTGTLTSGVHSNDDCSNWSSTAYYGSVGATSSTSAWTANGNRLPCDNIAHVYCFEQ